MLREIEIIRNLKHEYVARCLGSWIGKNYGLIFYRYMENGSLHDVLHENDPPSSLEWTVRYKIAVGVARGLAYLHNGCDPPILHRDIKPKNILLDSDLKPYITDFGISIALNQNSDMKRMRSTYHLGTPGFMAPETASSIVPSCKFDVYSYGVVLLELITRKKVLDSSFMERETTLAGWFKSVWRETRDIEEIVDSSLARELSDLIVVEQVIKVLLVALICTGNDPAKRMKMEDVIKIYEAPTTGGFLVKHDRTSFHLGSILAAAADSLYTQARTIVIKGLPKDVKQRELPNLLRWLPGYEASSLRFTYVPPIGYALFNTAQQAVAAKDILQGLLFDADTKSVLCTEMAKINYFVIRGGPSFHNVLTFLLRNSEYLIFDQVFGEVYAICNFLPVRDWGLGGTYDRGKQLWTGEDNPHTGCASTSASSSSNNPPHGIWGMHGNMASLPAPSTRYACLHDVLHVRNPLQILNWEVRYKIAVGIARQLAYLHHDCDPPIACQNINSKNIFLDSDMEPHIRPSGVSMPLNPSSSPVENGHWMVEAVASDVHDYGLVLLELLTRLEAFVISLSRVKCLWREKGALRKIVDSSLAWELSQSTTVREQVTKVLSVALLCTEGDPRDRPTMRKATELLWHDKEIEPTIDWHNGKRVALSRTGLKFKP